MCWATEDAPGFTILASAGMLQRPATGADGEATCMRKLIGFRRRGGGRLSAGRLASSPSPTFGRRSARSARPRACAESISSPTAAAPTCWRPIVSPGRVTDPPSAGAAAPTDSTAAAAYFVNFSFISFLSFPWPALSYPLFSHPIDPGSGCLQPAPSAEGKGELERARKTAPSLR